MRLRRGREVSVRTLQEQQRLRSSVGGGRGVIRHNVQLHAFALALDARPGALMAHLAVYPLGRLGEEVQRRDGRAAGGGHSRLAYGLHGDRGLSRLAGPEGRGQEHNVSFPGDFSTKAWTVQGGPYR